MSRESKILLGVLVGLMVAAGVTGANVRRLSLQPIVAQITVPHSAWLARCSALPVDALDGIEVIRATIRQDRVSALLRKGDRMGWLQCYRLGVYAGAPVFACYGPTILRDRMAADPGCSHAIQWSAVKDLPAAAKTAIAPWLVCCGSWTVAGQARSEVPCSWVLDGKATGNLTGYGPGVVGGDSPCDAYAP